MKASNKYAKIIESIFVSRYKTGLTEIRFGREELAETAKALGISTPKNLGDILYSFKYRRDLPVAISQTAPEGMEWVIRSVGTAMYIFRLAAPQRISPNGLLAETKIPDSTPGIISRYALGDEQALLARLRYNRLVDIFLGVTCYSLQNHLRTQVKGLGQIETDEVYVGVDQRGAQYVIPIQAKGGTDRLGVSQIEQDFLLCETKFPDLLCRPIAAQFFGDEKIALFLFEKTENGIAMIMEKHYRLVDSMTISREDLLTYRERLQNENGAFLK